MKTASTARKTYDTDSFMCTLYESLVRDFRAVNGADYKFREVVALRDSIKAFRDLPVPDCTQLESPYLFKQEVQLANLFKRYRFAADMYTDEELEQKTADSFKENQLRLCRHQWRQPKTTTHIVLQTARRYIRSILTDDALARSKDLCRFSNRATRGNAARDAYIDHKLADPITGHPEHVRWFANHLDSEIQLALALEECSPLGEPIYRPCTSLELVLVPKSFKSYRPIMPNTLIGSFHSYGMGQTLVEILHQEGLDIRKLQFKHRKYARLASKHRGWVTADLSAASESFLWWLIARLVPRKWLKELDRGRCREYTYNGKQYHYASFMAMGIGFTFPLQTLLFYSILKSIGDLLKVNGLISVYGDDLIYPRKIHKVVASVFEDIGFVLNGDKTHVSTHFRESCGGDYFRGVDVRPFSPEGQHQNLGARKYEAWLYQLSNGLFARWSKHDLPVTYRTIVLEILRVAQTVKQVPFSFPDYSGWRTKEPIQDPFLGFKPILTRFSNGSREYLFPHLTQKPKYRYVSNERAYLYEWLRAKEAGEVSMTTSPAFGEITVTDWMDIERLWKDDKRAFYRSTVDTFKLIPYPKQPRNYRSKSGRRLKRCIASTPCKLEPQTVTSTKGTISDWAYGAELATL